MKNVVHRRNAILVCDIVNAFLSQSFSTSKIEAFQSYSRLKYPFTTFHSRHHNYFKP